MKGISLKLLMTKFEAKDIKWQLFLVFCTLLSLRSIFTTTLSYLETFRIHANVVKVAVKIHLLKRNQKRKSSKELFWAGLVNRANTQLRRVNRNLGATILRKSSLGFCTSHWRWCGFANANIYLRLLSQTTGLCWLSVSEDDPFAPRGIPQMSIEVTATMKSDY